MGLFHSCCEGSAKDHKEISKLQYNELLTRRDKEKEVAQNKSIAKNPPNPKMEGKIVKISYCSFAVRLNGTKKVVYVHRFPPLEGTTVCPLLENGIIFSHYMSIINNYSMDNI